MKEIVVRARSTDIHACFANDHKCWESGSNISEAVGKLLRSHAKKLGIKVTVSDDAHTQHYLENPDIIKR